MSTKRFFSINKVFFLISFLLPFFCIFIYFAINNFNLLTVDLGQQYIDFLAFYRQNLFTNPLKLIYNFQNGLAGSMLATDAYYLMSPFNLILFLFKKSELPFAILLIIALKFAFSGLTSFYYWSKQKNYSLYYSLAASFAYALCGYNIANYFNLMWLDSIILLPLLIAAIDKLINQEKNALILITFALWVTNFYTGIMALFFGMIYFISQVIIKQKEYPFLIIKQYLIKSILGSLLASFILLPTFFELLNSKAQTQSNWSLSWQFNLLKELGKFTSGSYNFDEMESGLPNLFMSSSMLFSLIYYFFAKKIANREKIVNGSILIFFIISLSFTPLVLLWHLGQMPIWYPGRFSFIITFFCLNLAIKGLNEKAVLTFKQKLALGIIAIGLVSYWTIEHKQISYLTDVSLMISTLFVVLTLLFYFFIFNQHHFDRTFFISITTLELIINLILSLNNISFQENSDYQNFANNLSKVTNYTHQFDSSIFRLEKSFSRSDDDPFTAEYNGISTFNSVTDPKVLNFLAKLGYFHNSNSYNNIGGTPITDSFLGIKYYVLPNYNHDQINPNKQMYFNNPNHRLDLHHYALTHEFSQLLLLQNQTALPLLFKINFKQDSLKLTDNDPVYNQEKLLQYLVNKKIAAFKPVSLPAFKTNNLKKSKFNNQFIKQPGTNKGSLTINLRLKTNNSYYLNVPSNFNKNKIELFVNNHQINLDTRDNQDHLINLAYKQKHQILRITFIIKDTAFDFSDFNLYQMNNSLVDRTFSKLVKHQPRLHLNSALCLRTNNFSVKNKTQMLSTIPLSSNWLIFDNGKRISQEKFADTFIKFTLSRGKHQITMIYVPWLLIFGIIISLMTLFVVKAFL